VDPRTGQPDSLPSASSGWQIVWLVGKRIDDAGAVEILAVLQIFGEQIGAAAPLSRRHDQRIPPGERKALPDGAGLAHELVIYGCRAPGEKVLDVFPGFFFGEAQVQFLSHCHVILVQDLHAAPTRAEVPQGGEPCVRPGLFVGLGSIPGIDQQVGVNEAESAHGVLPGRDNAPCF